MRSTSARSVLLVVAVAALVALAGCSGGDDGTTTAPDETTDAPTDEMTTTADETGMTTTESGGGMTATTEESSDETTTEESSDDGTSGDGVSSQSLFSEHADAVEAAGSFTSATVVTLNSAQQNLTANTVVYGNIETGDGYQRSSLDGGPLSQTTEVYTRGDETWQRTNSSFRGLQYNYSTAPYDGTVQPVNTTQAVSGNLQFGGSELTWSEDGTETVDGVQTTRYSANDISSPERASSFLGSNVSSVENIQFEAFVDEDGIVRRLSLEFVGETERSSGQIEQTLAYEMTDIGSTSVPTPEWLDEARQQTDS